MNLRNKISCLLPVYNEAARIRAALGGLVPWADEVVVCDKGSTDDTAGLAASMGSQVRVVTIPYSDRGCEDHAALLRLVKNEWVYVAVCSEVPTRRLVTEMDRVLTEQGGAVDVVQVPRRMYVLGAHAPASVWSVSYYAFLVHRERVVTPGILHDHFRATSPYRIATIVYRPDTCVHHYTHQSVDAFVASHLNYAVNEAAVASPDAHFVRLREGLRAVLGGLCHDRTVQVHGMGYAIYSFLVCLKRYELDQGGPWKDVYAAAAARMLAQEWGGRVVTAGDGPVKPEPLFESDNRVTFSVKLYRGVMLLLVNLLVWLARRGAARSGTR